MDKKLAGIRVHLKMEFGFSKDWIQRTENWIVKSLCGVTSKIKNKLKKKFQFLKEQRENLCNNSKDRSQTESSFNNSSKQLTEEQLELLSIGLNFGIAPKKFPLVEYVMAMEILCQKLKI